MRIIIILTLVHPMAPQGATRIKKGFPFDCPTGMELGEALRNTERFWGDCQSAAFPPTGIYRHFFHLRFLSRSFAVAQDDEWEAGSKSRNADYKTYRRRRYHTL